MNEDPISAKQHVTHFAKSILLERCLCCSLKPSHVLRASCMRYCFETTCHDKSKFYFPVLKGEKNGNIMLEIAM